jgi:NAD+ synthase
MVAIYFVADRENRLVAGTTNKSEASSGFVVKWGDNVADIEPILPLFKTQVRELARYLDVSEQIIAKPSSPDLLPGIVDELALGIEYAALDEILSGLERGLTTPAIVQKYGVTAEQVRHVREMLARSTHLRELPHAPDLGA